MFSMGTTTRVEPILIKKYCISVRYDINISNTAIELAQAINQCPGRAKQIQYIGELRLNSFTSRRLHQAHYNSLR